MDLHYTTKKENKESSKKKYINKSRQTNVTQDPYQKQTKNKSSGSKKFLNTENGLNPVKVNNKEVFKKDVVSEKRKGILKITVLTVWKTIKRYPGTPMQIINIL